jgi:hypothetical protein
MLSIATKVEQIVSESAFLTEGMSLGLINLSELARQLRPQLESDLWKPVGQAAVVMALRRLSERLPQPGAAQPIKLSQRTGELTTRTELTLVTYRLSEHSNECQRQLLALAERQHGSFVSVTRGVHEMLVVCNRPLLHIVESAFIAERHISRIENLTALTLRLHPDTVKTPGVYHGILKKLAWNKINVVTMMGTLTELTVLLEPAQTAAAYALLSQSVTH